MTIIQPERSRKKLWPLASLIVVLLIGSTVFGVLLYNSTVDLRHSVLRLERDLEELRVKNAEFEDEMYSLLETNHLTALARELGLVMERKPRYLDTTADILAERIAP